MERAILEDEPNGPSRNHYTDWESFPAIGPNMKDNVNKLVEDMKGMAITLNSLKLEDIFDFIEKNKHKLNSLERRDILLDILKESGCDRKKCYFIRLTIKYVLNGRLQFHNLSRMAIFISTKMALREEISDSRIHHYFMLNAREFKEKDDIDIFNGLLEATNCNRELLHRIASILESRRVKLPSPVSSGLEAGMQIYPSTSCNVSGNTPSHSLNISLQMLENTVLSLERNLNLNC